MGLPVTYLFSHDSIAVGEDGPTHQPIEQIASLRMIPNFNVIRPCDANETAGAYEVAFTSTSTPTAIILTRQNLKTVRGCSKNKVRRGGYVLSYEKERLDGIILATGSEVNLAVEAQKELLEDDIDVRVVSMPSTFLFDRQKQGYKDSVLPSTCNKILAVEMGNGDAWYKYADDVMSIDRFGSSGPAEHVIEAYKFTVEDLVLRMKKLLTK
jgi:transketolase